jgi:dTDP-4-dehydrorhamnose reductase
VKVLVTGIQGQIGRALVAVCPPGVEIVGARHSDLDITRPDAVDAWVSRLELDLIINAAAYTAVDRAETEPEVAYLVNARAPRYLAERASAAGARMIHLSTDFVFDGESSSPYAPDAEPRPLSVYGATKLAGERAVRETLPSRSLVLRTAWVYASEGRNFLRTMLQAMRERGTVRVVADQIGTPTAAHSVAEVIWKLAESRELNGVFHWTDGGIASWYDFAVAIAEEGAELGYVSDSIEVLSTTTTDYPTPARRPRFTVLDKQLTIAATGTIPRHWRCNLRRVLREMRFA